MARSSTKAAPPREPVKASRYLRLSRNVTSSGPAVSSGATSANSRPPSSGFNRRAPPISASCASEKGPARSKKRGSAMPARSTEPLLLRFFLRRFLFCRLRRGRGRLRRRGREIHGQRRQLLVELQQHLIGYVEALIEQ